MCKFCLLARGRELSKWPEFPFARQSNNELTKSPPQASMLRTLPRTRSQHAVYTSGPWPLSYFRFYHPNYFSLACICSPWLICGFSRSDQQSARHIRASAVADMRSQEPRRSHSQQRDLQRTHLSLASTNNTWETPKTKEQYVNLVKRRISSVSI